MTGPIASPTAVALLDSGGTENAAPTWNQIGQDAVDAAFRTVLGARKRFEGRRNTAGHVCNLRRLGPRPTLTAPKPDCSRPVRPFDSGASPSEMERIG